MAEKSEFFKSLRAPVESKMGGSKPISNVGERLKKRRSAGVGLLGLGRKSGRQVSLEA